jgi:hypothetical protein
MHPPIPSADADKKNLDAKMVKFMFDGERLRGEQSPGEVDMDDGGRTFDGTDGGWAGG